MSAFDLGPLKQACPDAPHCLNYEHAFVSACKRDIDEASGQLSALQAKPAPSDAEKTQMLALDDRIQGAYAVLGGAAQVPSSLHPEKFNAVPAFQALQRNFDTNLATLTSEMEPPGLRPPTIVDKNGPAPLPKETYNVTSAPPVLQDATVTKIIGLSLAAPRGTAKVQEAGERYLAAGRPDQAERFGQALIDKAPKDSRGPSLMAEAALKENRPADAERWAQKALDLNPEDKKAKDALSFARAELSSSRLKKPVVGSFQEARSQDLDRSLAAPPRGPAGAPGRAAAAPAPARDADPVPRVLAGLLRRGYEKMNLGDLPGALEDVSVHLDAHPDDAEARLIRAEVLLKLGKPGPALADIDLALAKAPDDPRALRARAAALYELHRDDEALKAIERALAIEPASGIGHLTRAKILERLNRAAEAVAEYRTAAQLDPTLEPITEAALRRLGVAPAASKGVERGLLRGGFIVASLGLILLGLIGGAVVATRRARTSERAAAGVPRERTLKAGDLVAGQYRISRELGRGGMGVVFEAVDEKLKRSVALKQLQGDFRASAEDAARFLQEARLVAQLRHPNVAEIYAAVEDGGLYLVFELVRGRSLDSALGAGVTPEQARGIVAHVCAALTAAHGRRIVHRDLKPSNLMLSDDGEIKVMDFGIAHQSLHGGAYTQTSASGTPPYMAPEQAMGSVSSASDLYALGVMAYELLAGVRPFDGPDFLGPKMRGEFAPVTSRKAALPARLDAFFASALSPDPTRRPADAAAFASAFAACWS
jgi:tetratricopeptide (TPR) repeat protein